MLPRVDDSVSKDDAWNGDGSRKSTCIVLSNACYNHEIPFILTGLCFFLVYYVNLGPVWIWITGVIFLAMEVRIWITRLKYFQREFLYFWRRQLKMIILTCSAFIILFSDFYWAYKREKKLKFMQTVSVNAAIHFYIQADLAEVTLLLRITIPLGLIIIGIYEYYLMAFVLEDISIMTYNGQHHTLFHLKSFAWTQVLVFCILGFKAIVMDTKRKKFYLIERNLKRGPDYKTGGWMFSAEDVDMLVTCGIYLATLYLGLELSYQLFWGGLVLVFTIRFLRGVKLKLVFFSEYRPVLMIFSSLAILFCSVVRTFLNPKVLTSAEYLEHIFAGFIFVFFTLIALLSDFHTEPTKSFRLLLPLVVFIKGCHILFKDIFLIKNHVIIIKGQYKITLSEFERNAYMQILLLLFANFISLASDPSHSKFFLISRLRNREETRNYMIRRCIFSNRQLSLLSDGRQPQAVNDPIQNIHTT